MSERTSVYRLFDAEGRLLYIGVGRDVGMRFTSHRSNQPWWDDVCAIALTHYETREVALAVEHDAICDEKPIHNLVYSTTRKMITRAGGVGTRRKYAWRRVEKLAGELDRASRNALREGFSRAEVAQATGYGRDRMRHLAATRWET